MESYAGIMVIVVAGTVLNVFHSVQGSPMPALVENELDAYHAFQAWYDGELSQHANNAARFRRSVLTFRKLKPKRGLLEEFGYTPLAPETRVESIRTFFLKPEMCPIIVASLDNCQNSSLKEKARSSCEKSIFEFTNSAGEKCQGFNPAKFYDALGWIGKGSCLVIPTLRLDAQLLNPNVKYPFKDFVTAAEIRMTKSTCRSATQRFHVDLAKMLKRTMEVLHGKTVPLGFNPLCQTTTELSDDLAGSFSGRNVALDDTTQRNTTNDARSEFYKKYVLKQNN